MYSGVVAGSAFNASSSLIVRCLISSIVFSSGGLTGAGSFFCATAVEETSSTMHVKRENRLFMGVIRSWRVSGDEETVTDPTLLCKRLGHLPGQLLRFSFRLSSHVTKGVSCHGVTGIVT